MRLTTLILVAASAPLFAQVNASSDKRPVALGMQEKDGVLAFTLRNSFKLAVSDYEITVWALNDEDVPKRVCSIRPSDASPQEITIRVPRTCTVPRTAEGSLRRYTAKLSSIRVGGRSISYEPMPVSGAN